MRPIYLDHNATTPLDPRVASAMQECWAAGYANPSSQHRAGRRAAQVLEDTRDRIRELLGAAPGDRVIFTSGATEGNNLALLGLAGAAPGQVLVGATEHPSVLAAAEQLQRQGFDVRRLRVDADGRIDLDFLDDHLDETTRLVSVMAANHETGVLQPIDRIAARCAALGVPFHSDAVQLVGKLPVAFHALGLSALTLSAHKLHGPVGIGALLLRAGTPLAPRFFGGFQQEGLRPGTEPVALVKGLGEALELWHQEQAERQQRLTDLRDRFEGRLLESDVPVRIHGHSAPRAPHTSNVAFAGLDRQALLMALDLRGVACSSGSACASGSSEPSPVLRAMGLDDELVRASLRFSLGATSTRDDVDQAASRILSVAKDLRAKSGVQKSVARPPTPLLKPL